MAPNFPWKYPCACENSYIIFNNKGVKLIFQNIPIQALIHGFPIRQEQKVCLLSASDAPHTARNSARRKSISSILRSISLSNFSTHSQASWFLFSVKIAFVRKGYFISLCYGPDLMCFCKLQTCNFITLFKPWPSSCNLFCNSRSFKHSGHSFSRNKSSTNTIVAQLSAGLKWG